MRKYTFCEIGEAILNEDLPRLEDFISEGKINPYTRIHDIKFKRSSEEPMYLLILNFIGRYGTVKVMQFFLDHGFVEIKTPDRDYDIICSFCFRFAFAEIFKDFNSNLHLLRFLVQKGFTTNFWALVIVLQEFSALNIFNSSSALETIYLLLIATENITYRLPSGFSKFKRNPLENYNYNLDNRVAEWPMLLYSYCFQHKNTNPFFFLQNVLEKEIHF